MKDDVIDLSSYQDPNGNEYKPGIMIDDMLTREKVSLKRIISDGYNIGFVVDHAWLEGHRHPWEICISGRPWGPSENVD